jgi:tetratricopeptide (TPR) repeat protein
VEEHPTTEDFARFLQQSPQPSYAERNALVVRHLLADCAVCRRTLREVEGLSGLLERLLEIPLRAESQAPTPYNYEWAFAKTDRALTAILAKGLPSEQLPERLKELAGLSDGEQLRRVSRDPRFWEPELIHCLIERSHSARYRSPRKTLQLARLAHAAAGALTPEKAGGELALADLRAKAWGNYANALRIAGRPLEAEEAFTTAESYRKAGSCDPTLHGWLLERMAALAIFQNRYADAVEMSDAARDIYQGLGRSDLLASTMIRRAIATLYSGKAEVAIPLLLQAIPLIDAEEDPHLILAAQHNLTTCYLDLGRPDEALAFHYTTRQLYQECQDPLIQLRAIWLEGRVLREVGHWHNAEVALLRARAGFMEQGLVYEVGLVSLDLATVYSKLDRIDEFKQVLTQALPIFRTLRVDHEFLASYLWLQQTVGSQVPET